MDSAKHKERHDRVVKRTEDYLHAAKRVAIDILGTDAAHGHAETITRIAQIMATLETADIFAEDADNEDN